MEYTNIKDANARIVEIEAENTNLVAEITILKKDKERLNDTITRQKTDLKELREAVTTSNVKTEKIDRVDFKTIRNK